MRILFVPSWFPSKDHPTLGNFVLRHAEAISTEHDIRVLYALFSRRRWWPAYDETKASENGPITGIFYLPAWLKPFRKFVIGQMLRRLHAWKWKPELVHGHVLVSHGVLAAGVARELDLPLVFTEHWTGFLPINRKTLNPETWRKAIEIAQQAQVLCPVSHNLSASMEQLGIKGHFRVVDNAVDTALFRPGGSALKTTDPRVFRWLHVSTFHAMKNIPGLLDGFRLALDRNSRPMHLTLAGDGDKAMVAEWVESRNLSAHVSISGPHGYSEIAQLMQQSDAFVLFSDYENLPCVIAEAHCCGLPVLTTAVGGISEMITPENGLMVRAGDTTALAEAMDLISGVDYKADETHISHTASARYGYRAIATAYTQVYQEALANKIGKSKSPGAS